MCVVAALLLIFLLAIVICLSQLKKKLLQISDKLQQRNVILTSGPSQSCEEEHELAKTADKSAHISCN